MSFIELCRYKPGAMCVGRARGPPMSHNLRPSLDLSSSRATQRILFYTRLYFGLIIRLWSY